MREFTSEDARPQGRSEESILPEAASRLPRVSASARRALRVGRSAREEYGHLYRLMAVTDALSVMAALLIAYELRFGPRMPSRDFVLLLCAAPFFVVSIFTAFRLYGVHQFTPAEEFRRIILAVSVGLTGMVTLAFWSKSSFSRSWIAMSWAIALLLALFTRRLWHWWAGRARARGSLLLRTLIVGTNSEAHRLVDVMSRPSFGYRPIGFVRTSQSSPEGNGRPVLGDLRSLRELIREMGAECIFVAASAVGVAEMSYVAKAVRLEGVEVRVTATLPEVLSSRLSVQPVGGLMALSLKPVRLTGSQIIAKRAFDLLISGIGILVTLPLWAATAGFIKLTSPGPVLFRQRRVGQRGRPFTILKFRTMVVGADRMQATLQGRNEASGPLFKLRDDPRVTRVGRWLRKWSLDELPQLLNVLGGDMSLVGPRPPLPEEVREYQDWQFDRLEVRPGITGLWQVSGRSELSFDEYVRLDLFYIENWSLAYDLYILAKTAPILLSRRGAY